MRTKDIFFHAVILLTVAGTAWLGAWQLQRREWKHNLILSYEAAAHAAPAVLRGQITAAEMWQRFYVDGTVDYDRAVLLPTYIQPEDKICGQTGWGYRLLAPLTLKNGQTILYQDGFIPDVIKNDFHGKHSGRLTVSVWPLQVPSGLPPHNSPATKEWLVLDQSMYDAWHTPRQSFYLNSEFSGELMMNDGSQECDYPVNYWRKPVFTDNHLQYAITWFALAGVLLALYIYRVWQNKPSAKTPNPDRFKDNS